MAKPTSYEDVVNDADHTYASFDLGGWVGAMVAIDGRLWVAIRRPGGEETVGPSDTLRHAARHYSSVMQQAALHAEEPAPV